MIDKHVFSFVLSSSPPSGEKRLSSLYILFCQGYALYSGPGNNSTRESRKQEMKVIASIPHRKGVGRVGLFGSEGKGAGCPA